jgi:hypothetical protein
VPTELDEIGDPGLARERTTLARNRSGLALLVCVAVLLRRVWPLPGGDRLLAIGFIAVGGMIWALIILILEHNQRVPGSTSPLGQGALTLITAGTLVLAATAVVLTLLTPS